MFRFDRSRAFAAAFALVCFVLPAAYAIAQEEEPDHYGSVKVVESKAAKYRSVANLMQASGFDGARGVFRAPAGKAMLVVNLEIAPETWGKDEYGDEACAGFEEAIWVEVDGEKTWSIGSCTPDGRFERDAAQYSFYDSGEPLAIGFDPVFVVPENATKAKLNLGGTTTEIEFAGETKERIDPTQAIDLKVESAKVVDELKQTETLGVYDRQEQEIEETIETTAGRFLLVSFVVKPKARNQTDGYYGFIQDYALLLGKQVYLSPIGAYSQNEFQEYAYDFGFERDALGQYNASRVTLIYPLPGNVSTGKLLYLGAPVADLTFDK